MASGIGGIPSDWASAMTDPQAFRREQDRLSHVWTFLGLTRDVARDGDWFRASLATRSVFVQRFGDELKGFENRCAHRGYPLRNADKGNGPIVCGFHHWRYDQAGRALGIPAVRGALRRNSPRARREAQSDRDRDLRQPGVRPLSGASRCRCPSGAPPRATESLEDFLGTGFPILAAMSQMPAAPIYVTNPVKANWKLCLHITFDDYHGPAVHPGTFGKLGYLRRYNITYARFGLHSCAINHPDPQALEKMAAACRDGTFRSAYYRIFQIMPNLILSHFRSDGQFWFCVVEQYVPVAHDRSQLRAWLYPGAISRRTAPRWRSARACSSTRCAGSRSRTISARSRARTTRSASAPRRSPTSSASRRSSARSRSASCGSRSRTGG